MSKYRPLTHDLRKQAHTLVEMTFLEIEAVIGLKLPRSADTHRAWWSNNASNNVMTKAWLEAGFETEHVDLLGRKLVFRRVVSKHPSDDARLSSAPPSGFMEPSRSFNAPIGNSSNEKRGLFGGLRGTLSHPSGTDLTRPADPGWSKQIDDDSQSVA